MWEQTPIEEKLHESLNDEFSQPEAEKRYAHYIDARSKLVEQILEEIRGVVPELTDHGPRHIHDVLKNTGLLLGDQISELKAIELYILCISVLFHDVGNLFGRKKHNRNISKIYRHVRGNDSKFRSEQNAVQEIAGAHTGCVKDGDKDTLKDLSNNLAVYTQPVRAQKIAALLRFADELAEGQQRTSAFMQNHHMYPDVSEIYHKYASVTEHCIDKDSSRIAIDYNFEVEDDNGDLVVGHNVKLEDILEFTYTRITKLDQERRYNKHYCPWLANFKRTSATYRFWLNGEVIDLEINPIELSDLIVPGEKTKTIVDLDPEYKVSSILDRIKSISKP